MHCNSVKVAATSMFVKCHSFICSYSMNLCDIHQKKAKYLFFHLAYNIRNYINLDNFRKKDNEKIDEILLVFSFTWDGVPSLLIF